MTQQKLPILDEQSEGNDHSISKILNRLSFIHFDYMEKDSFYCNPDPDKDKPKRMNGWTFFCLQYICYIIKAANCALVFFNLFSDDRAFFILN